jgi:tRNA(Ile)-lysidine synthase
MQQQLNNQTVVLAISTGIDSMVLLDIVQKLKNVKIVVAHVNHHRRVQSNEEQEFIPCLAFDAD